jgi:AcrR family transcriptional regulator
VLEHGVVGLSLSELARSIGSNNRMLLYHFGSLDNVLSAVVNEVLDGESLHSRIADLLHADASSADRITAAWRHISDPVRLPQLRLFFGRFGQAADDQERYREFLDRTLAEWVGTVAGALREDPEVTRPDDKAMAIVGLWRGLQILLISGGSASEVDRVHDDAVRALLPAR